MPTEPDIKHAVAFFDAQNLYQHAKSAFGHHHPNFDPIKLHRAVCAENGWRPTLVRFYTGFPAEEHSPMWHGYWTRRVLGLKRAGVAVTTRPLRYRSSPENPSIYIAQEKGIDIRLALDLVSSARKKQFDVAVIYSQDQDLSEIAEEIREIGREQNRWIKLGCAFPASATATSNRGINGTDWFRMDESSTINASTPGIIARRGTALDQKGAPGTRSKVPSTAQIASPALLP